MKKVECYDCGKKFEVIDALSIQIPKYRCDDCLNKIK
jgi:DNA-directed RNA polymerase subunit RPC12/RpoP